MRRLADHRSGGTHRPVWVVAAAFLVAACVGVTPAAESLEPSVAPAITPSPTLSARPSTAAPSLTPSPAATAAATPATQLTPEPQPTPASTDVPPSTSTPEPTSTPVETPAAGWSEPVLVDPAAPEGYDAEKMLRMLVDDAGNVHVAETLHDGIYYLTNAEGEWTRTRLTRAPRRGSDGQPSIAYDPSYGLISIAFTRWSRYEPCFFCPNGGSEFAVEGIYVVEQNVSGGWNDPYLLIPGMAQPSLQHQDLTTYLAYAPDENGEDPAAIHYYVSSDGTEEGNPFTAKVADGGTTPVLRLASDLTPRIMYWTDAMVYATAPSPIGPFALEDGPDNVDGSPFAFELGPDDVPYAALGWGPTIGTKQTASGWAGLQEFLGNELGGMDVDIDGSMHVVSLPLFDTEAPESGIWYATDRDGSVSSQAIKPAADIWETEGAGFPATIALDPNGRPHVIFSWLEEPSGLYYAVGPAR